VQFAAIRGAVFDDANHNAARDAGEAGVAGVTVFIDANQNGTLDSGEPSAVTDGDGSYVIGGLGGGSFLVREVPPAGTRRTTSVSPVVAQLGENADGPVFGNVKISAVPLNFAYLLSLAQHYDQSATFATGDLNDDGQVNFDDLLLLAQHYGRPLTLAAGAKASLRHRLKFMALSGRAR
jgi:hypothetical protein